MSAGVLKRAWASDLQMNDGDKPQLYREAAESLRRLASQAPLPDIQGDVLDLSAGFERMAMYFEAQLRLGAAGEERDDQTVFGCGAAVAEDVTEGG